MCFIKKFINFILNIFFPPKCVFCGKILEPYSQHSCIDDHKAYCDECKYKIRFCKDYNRCSRCGKPSATFDPNGLCVYCEKETVGFKKYRGISVLFYEGVVKNSVLRYKLGGKKHYAKTYAYLMCNEIERELGFVKFNLVTSAPPTVDNQKYKKGFEHAEVIARKISKRLNVKYKTCLKKLSSAKHQRGLSYAERIKNLDGKIKLLKNRNVKNKTILLVDDVCTTGSTLRECAKVLLRNGAKEVYSITLATVVKENCDLVNQITDKDLYNINLAKNENLSFSLVD